MSSDLHCNKQHVYNLQLTCLFELPFHNLQLKSIHYHLFKDLQSKALKTNIFIILSNTDRGLHYVNSNHGNNNHHNNSKYNVAGSFF